MIYENGFFYREKCLKVECPCTICYICKKLHLSKWYKFTKGVPTPRYYFDMPKRRSELNNHSVKSKFTYLLINLIFHLGNYRFENCEKKCSKIFLAEIFLKIDKLSVPNMDILG